MKTIHVCMNLVILFMQIFCMIMICLTERVSEVEIFSVSLKNVMFTIDHIISLKRNIKSLS